MRAELRVLTIVLCISLSGCISMKLPVMPPQGGIFTNIKMPLSTDFNATAVRQRKGTTKTFFIREPFYGTSYAWGDVSIEEAARKGRLKNVSYADAGFLGVLGMFGMLTVQAYGE